MGAKEDLCDKDDSRISFKKEMGVAKDCDLIFSVSKPKKVKNVIVDQQLTSDVKQQKANERCLQESYLQNQCHGEIRIPKYMSFVGLSKNLVQHCLDLVEIRSSNSLGIICREAGATSFNFPINVRSSKLEILFDSLKPHRRRTRSTSDLGFSFTEYISTAGPGDIIFSPAGQWFANSIDKNSKARSLMKSPLVRRLGAAAGGVNLDRAKSGGVKESRFSGFMSSPSAQSISSPKKLVRDIIPLQKQRYGSEFTDKTPVSCSSSTSSYQSTSSACGAASMGVLHCIWKNGLPYFMFSVDDQADVYVANPCKVESSADKALDYIYLFHSGKGDKKESCADNMSSLVGKMKVSNSTRLSYDNEKLMETEFVLFGTSEDGAAETQSSTHMIKGNKGLMKKAVDVFRANHSSKHKSSPIFSNTRSLSGEFSQVPCLDMLGELDELGKGNHIENYVPPNLELAAIIVKDYQCEKTQEASVGGWGLKFLKKVTVDHANTSLRLSSGSSQDGSLRVKSRPVKSLNVLVPAGFHGGPKAKYGGPSSLTERWRSGGQCDCGGWDIGCPITVLNNRSSELDSLSKKDAEGDCKSFDLFTKGMKEGESTLKMVNVHEGLYFIHFQPSLSALQSFSVGVAIIHSQCQSLSKKVYRS